MGSVYNQPARTINWDAWSRIVDAAQDPQRRDTVQEFLATADLSGEIPAALDEKFLAPMRSTGATGEQCAFVLCNLGFAALAVAGSKGSAEFAMACGPLVEQLAPESPDLTLRRHFLSAKAILVVAALADQPHLLWGDVAARCSAYLRAIESRQALTAEAIAPHAAAAYSFASQYLSRVLKLRAVDYYAAEVSQLIDNALRLAKLLPATIVTRMWSTLMPGTDASVFFRHVGAAAECSLQHDGNSPDHAEKGLAYIGEILAQSSLRPAPEQEHILQIRAELLLSLGRHAEASEQAVALQSSSDRSVREQAIAITARCHLGTGNPRLAAEILAPVAQSTDQALERWRAIWMGETGDGHWTAQPDAFSSLNDRMGICRLQAVAAADTADMAALLEAANRSTGFLADSLLRDRQDWIDRIRTAYRGAATERMPPPEQAVTTPSVADIDPLVAVDEILTQLADGTALLQVINTQEGILTWVARKQAADVSVLVAPDRPNANRLYGAHKAWSRACLDSLRDGAGSPAEGAALFSALMDEVGHNWGDLLQGLLDDGITQLVLIGDDLFDIPLHACPIGLGTERLIDHVPVTYAPSLTALRACISRSAMHDSKRDGVVLRSLIDTDLESPAADALAATLGKKPGAAGPAADSFWNELAAAQVLHIVARTTHNARLPFESLLGEGWLDLRLAELVAELHLPQCELVATLACESALPATCRAPGLDLSAIFLAAGARSVLASTWVVREEIGSDLAQSFFVAWVSGRAPAAAFQHALRQLRVQHPALPDYHWAGMRLVGAP